MLETNSRPNIRPALPLRAIRLGALYTMLLTVVSACSAPTDPHARDSETLETTRTPSVRVAKSADSTSRSWAFTDTAARHRGPVYPWW